MPLYIRDERAVRLAKQLAQRKSVTMTDAVIDALQGALERETRPLWDRVVEIAREVHRRGDREHGQPVEKEEIDALWGHE
jgi:antitoxin VapB